MKVRKSIFVSLVVVGFLGLFTLGAFGQDSNPFKLKPGARGKNCLECHVDFQAKLKSKYVHTPVKEGDCTGCHNPHASSHGKLLAAEPGMICLTCHDDIQKKDAVSTHQAILDGGCIKCHDPHGTDNKSNLLAAGNQLCFGCHKDIQEATEKDKVKHEPVTEGCLSCHNPHQSAKADHLLSEKVPGLCLECHDAGAKVFKAVHMNYPVQKGRCTSCHNPHGGNAPGILYATTHKPMADKMCNQCHEAADSANPFATKKQGAELCRTCHSTLITEALNKKMLHWPVLSGQGCLNCHSPHASAQKALLKEKPIDVCGSCHADTIERQKESKTKHKPVAAGQCLACHSPHSSDNTFFLKDKSQKELCGTCHKWQSHSTHPIGEKAVDPRNKNRIVMCTSCHRVHGNSNEHMFHYSPAGKMCVQCHTKQFRR